MTYDAGYPCCPLPEQHRKEVAALESQLEAERSLRQEAERQRELDRTNWAWLLDVTLFNGSWECVVCGHPTSQHAYSTGSCRTCWGECPKKVYQILAASRSGIETKGTP